MKYYPILLSKEGELTALSKLLPAHKSDISPIIQVLSGSIDNVQALLLSDWTFANNQVLLDFSLFENIDSNITGVKGLLENLNRGGVNIIPVVDSNSSDAYIDLVTDVFANLGVLVCIRRSSTEGFVNFYSDLQVLTTAIKCSPDRTLLLLDFNYVNQAFGNLAIVAVNVVQGLPHLQQWAEIIISAGSFPENLNNFTAQRVHVLPRYEWQMWLAIQAQGNFGERIKYSDYGTKYPFYSEARFQGTCSIKYSTTESFVIYRGELSQNHRDGNGQYITFARQLVASRYYYGATFSWGDSRIDEISRQNVTDVRRKPGNAGSWVKISQNHHLTLIESIL